MTNSTLPVIQNDFNLQLHNTLGIEAYAKYFVSVSGVAQLEPLLGDPRFDDLPKLVLGGGSNILFAGDFMGLVIHIDMMGKEIIEEDGEQVRLRIGAGENWHQLVLHCVDRGWGGIENLSLIPGKVGAAPIQNIGAYGVELEEVFESLTAVELESGDVRKFDKKACEFAYRDSIFKNAYKDQFIITDVTLNLSKNPDLNTSYGSIQQKLREKGIDDPTIKDISDIVIEIRENKLPNPSDLGNAGSFFKNPVIERNDLTDIEQKYPDLPQYPVNENKVKIPAGWLIEKVGWKGKEVGKTGTYRQQALVIVNHGGATGKEILNLAEKIKTSVVEEFGIDLVPEVNIIG